MKKVFAIIMILLYPALILAQGSQFELSGYAKYLYSSLNDPLLETSRLNDHLVHSRINTRWYPASSLTAVMELRFRGFYGSSVEKVSNFQEQIQSHYEFKDLDVVLWENNQTLGYGEIDRLYLDYVRNDLQVTLGRQRIAWGTSLVWNITDLFNPKSILDFDYEELPGADVIRFQYFTGAVSKVEMVYKPGRDKYSSTFAGFISVNKYGYDLFAILGIQNARKVLAAGWAGDIAGGGFRGEFKLMEKPSKLKPHINSSLMLPSGNFVDNDNLMMNFVLSGDYTFSNSLYIHSELMYNNLGKIRNAGLFHLQANEIGMHSPARWSVFNEIAYDITPLIRGNVFSIYNPDDQSAIVVPAVTWSVITNLDLTLLGYTSVGKSATEFGEAGDMIFLRTKYSF